MTHPLKSLFNTLAIVALLWAAPSAVLAADGADCEIVLMQVIDVDPTKGEAQAASFLPAADFMRSVRDKTPGHMTDVNGQPIRIVMCRRNDVIPAKSDYAIMATGIPFVLSQDFDSQDTDSMTMFWKDGKFQYIYKGYPLSTEAERTLETRLTDFSKRGLKAKAPN